MDHMRYCHSLLSVPLLLLTPFMPTMTSAQCELFVDPMATVISMDSTITAPEGYYWVCEGAEVMFSGELNYILGEPGSMIHVFGDNNTVITKGAVMLHGMNTNVYALDESFVDDQGTNSDVAYCSEIIFHLDDAPKGGCLGTGMANGLSVDDPLVLADPIQQTLTLDLPPSVKVQELRLMDSRGRLLANMPAHNGLVVPISSYAAGLLTVVLMTEQGPLVRKVLKER